MLVQDLMTRQPVTITRETRVKEAARLATEHKVSSLPVVGEDGLIHGIVTESDLIRGAFAHDARAHERLPVEPHVPPPLLVSEVMTSPAITVRQRADLAEVVELMIKARLKSLPVVDDAGRVVGVVSRSDVVRIRARTDEQLAEELAALLTSLEHPDWQLDVRDGVVRITGPETALDRSIAEAAANSVAGVVDVQVG